MTSNLTYSDAILEGFKFLLDSDPNFFIIGQGLWSPWYVGKTMTDLDKIYGKDRIIDTPVSENCCTGIAVGAAITGVKSIVVHPRMDFMLYALDPIVNQAAKWSHMFGGQCSAGVTVRAIINRGGQQGAQHSQSLHSWFSHIPGLNVLMPSTPSDARDFLIAATLSDNPCIYIDDRWLYDEVETYQPPSNLDINLLQSRVIQSGSSVTVVSVGYGLKVVKDVLDEMSLSPGLVELIDLRILNPLRIESVITSVEKTRKLIVVDPGWKSCGISAEVIASVCESVPTTIFDQSPVRITLPASPAPCAPNLEHTYYDLNSRLASTLNQFLS